VSDATAPARMEGTGDEPATGGRTARTAVWIRPERVKEFSLVGVIVLMLLVFSFLVDDYLGGRFFNRVTASVAITAVLAVAQTIVIVTRNIDLSVGSIVGVTAYITGEFARDNPSSSPAAAIALAIGIGLLLGVVNGVIVAYGRVPAIVATLGTLAIYRSWLVSHGEGRTITADSLPSWVVDLPTRTVGGVGGLDVRVVFAVVVVIVAVLQVAMQRLRWGRRLYAIGSNPGAAAQAGLPTQRLVLGAFCACGALSGFAGFLFLARFGNITVVAGQGLELDSVAAAVVGGVSVLGGSGTLVGAFLGAVLIDVLDQSLVRVPQVSEFWRNAILGGLILLAVVADAVIGRRFRRRWSAEARPHTRVDASNADDAAQDDRATAAATTSPSPEKERTDA
jgi:rhamnose transport system permease protein